MPRFYFHIIEGERRLEDEDGDELSNLDAAIEQAEQIIREILEEEEARVDVGSIRIEITEEAGEVLAEVDFEDRLTGNGLPPGSIH